MGIYYAFILTAILVGSLGVVDKVEGNELPTEVVTIWEGPVSIDIEAAKLRSFLLPEKTTVLVPDAYLAYVTCYSDHSGHMRSLDQDSDNIWSWLNREGRFTLNTLLVNMGSDICDEVWEELYGTSTTTESLRSWYL